MVTERQKVNRNKPGIEPMIQPKTRPLRQAPPFPSAHPSIGNQRALRRAGIQAKLTLGPVNDPYEREAERAARQVAASTSPRQQMVEQETEASLMGDIQPVPITHLAQRQGNGAGGDVTTGVERGIRQAQGSGRPLPGQTRSHMERAFSADFSGVRVHHNPQADALNRSLNARAFTTGKNIFFRQGEYAPGSAGGQRLLAHELTHVMQQNGPEVQTSPHSSDRMIQRTVLMAVDDIPETIKAMTRAMSFMDFMPAEAKNFFSLVTLMQHADYAYQKVGGPVIDFSDTTALSQVTESEHLFIVEHGQPGSIGGKDAQAVIDLLHAQLPTAYKGQIDISSCFAGAEESGPDTSLVTKVGKGLEDHGRYGITIRGAKGPTITHSDFVDEDYFVVKPTKVTEFRAKDAMARSSSEARQQIGLFKKWVRKYKGGKPEEIGAKVAELTRDIDRDLLQDLRTDSMLMDTDAFTEYRTRDPNESNGICFITTACTQARGLPDDCEELTVLRAFRDNYMQYLPGGPAMIAAYYDMAPAIVAAIDQRADSQAIYDELYGVIRHCVEAIQAEKPQVAFVTYSYMVIRLKRLYLEEEEEELEVGLWERVPVASR